MWTFPSKPLEVLTVILPHRDFKVECVWVAIAGRTAGGLQGNRPHSQAPFTELQLHRAQSPALGASPFLS